MAAGKGPTKVKQGGQPGREGDPHGPAKKKGSRTEEQNEKGAPLTFKRGGRSPKGGDLGLQRAFASKGGRKWS